MENEANWYDSLNIKKNCSKYKVSIFQCPQFLFLLMGILIIVAIAGTYEMAKSYGEPEVAALIVLAVSAVIFIIGEVVINSFERVAVSSLAKSDFISIISHQLRSPLSVIKWQINMLTGEKTNGIEVQDDMKVFLETIYSQNEIMIKSVSDLLDVNRIEDGNMILTPENFSLVALTQKVIDEYRESAIINNINVFLNEGAGLLEARADPIRIKRVIEHLLDNAIRYSLNGGKISVNIEMSGANIIWKITDEGAGIPHDDRKRIFEKFFRSKNVTRYKTSGSGLGLFIAKSIVKLSGGRMEFLSLENKGSTFWFSLPTAGKFID